MTALLLLPWLLMLAIAPIQTNLLLGGVWVTIVIASLRSPRSVGLMPFVVYPFMFLIRARDPENVGLVLMPDIVAIAACVYYFSSRSRRRSWSRLVPMLCVYALAVSLLNLVHVGDVRFIPVIARQYALPVFFVAGFLLRASRDTSLPGKALRLSIASYSLVCLLSLLNVMGRVRVEPSIEALYPYLNYVHDSEPIGGARSIGNISSVPRLNPFLGGALGSSAGVLLALALVSLSLPGATSQVTCRLAAVPLALSAVLTLSTSVMISPVVWLGCLVAARIGKVGLVVFATLAIGTLSSFGIFLDESPLVYARDSLYAAFLKFVEHMTPSELLLGVGPRIVSAGYEYIPDRFIIDVGILRVLIENGVVCFLWFLAILYIPARRIVVMWSSVAGSNPEWRAFVVVFVVFLCLVHANMTALPPFYPLFACCLAGVLVVHEGGEPLSG